MILNHTSHLVTSDLAFRYRSWPSDRWCDRFHQTSVRHLGDDGEHGEQDGEHRHQWEDTGEETSVFTQLLSHRCWIPEPGELHASSSLHPETICHQTQTSCCVLQNSVARLW